MSQDSRIVIAIDGPAGAGKSTVSKLLAMDLGLTYLDTGAMYRALALKASQEGVNTTDGQALADLLNQTAIDFALGEPQPVLLDSVEVTEKIRTLEVGDLASKISAFPEVRQAMVERQKEFIKQGNIVLEGRDTTTVVAPNATLKVYLTASLEERAKRRSVDYVVQGGESNFEDVRSQILVRDHRDITRQDSPLKVASGALLIESGGLSIEEVVQQIKAQLKSD